MKVRKNLLLVIFLFSIVLVLAACGGTEDAGKISQENSGDTTNGDSKTEETFELNLNSPVPSTHGFAGNLFEPWAESVEEKTDGRVKVNLYHGGTLGTSSTSWDDINNRV